MSIVEVFTGSCRLCEAAVDRVQKAVGSSGHEVIVRSIDGPEAKAYGLTSVPSVVKDGEIVFTRLPTVDELVEAFRETETI